MNRMIKSVLGSGLVFMAAFASSRAQYSLEKLDGVTSDYGAQFNNLDQVIAGSKLWANGVASTLAGLGGGFTVARHINNRGEIIGVSTVDQDFALHAVVWKNGVITDLTATAPNSLVEANGLNDLGQIVGTVTTSGVHRAVMWSDLDAPPVTVDGILGYAGSYGEAINNRGIVAGLSTPFNNGLSPTAFLRDGSSLVQVGSAGNIYGSWISDINDAGVVVGQQNGFAFWYDGSFHEIGPFGYGRSGAAGVNAFGEIVGSTYSNGVSHPFIYANGVLTDLDSLFPSVLPENQHFRALDINDKGDLLLSDDRNFLYLARADSPHSLPGLSPVPEPASFGFVAASGLIGFVLAKRRRFFTARR